MVQLQQDLDAIEATATHVVGVSYDSVETLKNFTKDKSIKFMLLSDEGSHVIRAYGIEDRDGYPHPGTYLIDQSGIIRASLFSEGYRTRHANELLIEAARKLNSSTSDRGNSATYVSLT